MRPPRGYTLLEMIAFISIGTLLMGFAVVLLHSLLTADRVAKEAQERATVSRRLADDFRRDVHAARKADVAGTLRVPSSANAKTAEPTGSLLTLQDFAPGVGIRSVRYEIHANEVLRVEERDQGNRYESYFLLEGASAAFRRKTEGAAQWVELAPLPPKRPSLESTMALSVETALGADRRFEK
jgi:hypothetical protein